MAAAAISIEAVPVGKPEDVNVIVGQAHFIKTVEDLHEAMVGVSPHLKFGLAFCEASGDCLIRRSGNDDELMALAVASAEAIGAGHAFVIMPRHGFPLNVLNPLKMVPEVATIFCATANPLEILVAVTGRGRGVIGVVDGAPPVGIETAADAAKRYKMLRDFGYKL
jgi:adenosine/AMP kinase